jgi:glycosyltransferase involved in cell wall biosynthesis
MWLTVPELCARFLPERLAAGLLYRLGIHHALKRADHIFTISKSAATAISAYMPECIGRLTAIHHGTEPFFHQIPKEEARQDLRRLSPIPETFVLCVGQGSPYKNHLRAVQAFLQATSTWPEIKLVLVRRFKRFDSQMQRLLQQEKVQKKIVVLPAVTEKELRALYNLAAVLLFPSLEEGFGMPVLEAMACGTPVVASDIPVMREVAQDAALLADPTSTTAIAAELARLLGDENLQQEMAARGLSNLRRFSWQKCAELTLAGYRQVVAGCR